MQRVLELQQTPLVGRLLPTASAAAAAAAARVLLDARSVTRHEVRNRLHGQPLGRLTNLERPELHEDALAAKRRHAAPIVSVEGSVVNAFRKVDTPNERGRADKFSVYQVANHLADLVGGDHVRRVHADQHVVPTRQPVHSQRSSSGGAANVREPAKRHAAPHVPYGTLARRVSGGEEHRVGISLVVKHRTSGRWPGRPSYLAHVRFVAVEGLHNFCRLRVNNIDDMLHAHCQ
jgi:hypothetical protein